MFSVFFERGYVVRIVKELLIREVKAAWSENAPYQIVLDAGLGSRGKDERNSLTFDADALARHMLEFSFDLAGRELICSFESHTISLVGNENEYQRWNTPLHHDDVVMRSLRREEEITHISYSLPPSNHVSLRHVLVLSTLDSGGSIHPIPCPFYHLSLHITREEYARLKRLSPHTAFRAGFSLKEREHADQDAHL